MKNTLKHKRIFFFIMVFVMHTTVNAQKRFFSVTGNASAVYEGYGLSRNPAGFTGYRPRRPWNQSRISFSPVFKFGKYFSLPLNINFATTPTNFAGPFSGIKKQTIGQFISNPMNNFGINPKYKWVELQLGTQYLKYSDLSTGDVGIFGAGFILSPGDYRIKFFTGVSQQGINFTALPVPGTPGAFKRTHYMFSIGKEKEGDYLVSLNFSKGKDKKTSAIIPVSSILPQEGFTMSMVFNKELKKGWYVKTEAANSFYTGNLYDPYNVTMQSFKPFISARNSTVSDYAGQLALGKKSPNFDIGLGSKYIGAGFQTTGYPYLQPDRFEYTVNTRFNAFKKTTNVTASIGQRVNNISSTTTKAKQFIGNLNWFTQFNDKFSLNLSFNNFGFNTNGFTASFIPSIRNVSTDIGVSPTYTWVTTKMSHTLGLSYNYSRYNETFVLGSVTSTQSNNTNTFLLSYTPVYFTKNISPDFSALYFQNDATGAKISFTTLSAGISVPLKKKIKLRGQLQYTIGKLNSFSSDNNLIASCGLDVKINKKLTWTNYINGNYYKYGNQLGIPFVGANYLESTYRTGLQYKF